MGGGQRTTRPPVPDPVLKAIKDRLRSASVRQGYFGMIAGLPPGVPGGAITGVFTAFSLGGVTTFSSGVGGGLMTPRESESLCAKELSGVEVSEPAELRHGGWAEPDAGEGTARLRSVR